MSRVRVGLDTKVSGSLFTHLAFVVHFNFGDVESKVLRTFACEAGSFWYSAFPSQRLHAWLWDQNTEFCLH